MIFHWIVLDLYPYDLHKNAEKPEVISFLSQIFCQKAVDDDDDDDHNVDDDDNAAAAADDNDDVEAARQRSNSLKPLNVEKIG